MRRYKDAQLLKLEQRLEVILLLKQSFFLHLHIRLDYVIREFFYWDFVLEKSRLSDVKTDANKLRFSRFCS